MADELQLVVFRLDDQRYAVDLAIVERVFPMVAIAPLRDGPAIALGVINVHGRVVPVVDTRQRFGLPAREYELSSQLLMATTSRRTLALPVDEVIGVVKGDREAMIPAEAVLPGLHNLSGVIPLADDMLFVHDLEAFLSLDDEAQLTEALGKANPDAAT